MVDVDMRMLWGRKDLFAGCNIFEAIIVGNISRDQCPFPSLPLPSRLGRWVSFRGMSDGMDSVTEKETGKGRGEGKYNLICTEPLPRLGVHGLV